MKVTQKKKWKNEWEKWNVGFSRGSLALLYTLEKGKTKKLYKLYTKPYTNSAFCWYSAFYDVYSLCFKLYTNYTQTLHWGVQDPTQRVFAKLYTKRNTNPTFCFWTRISRMEFRTRKVRKEWMVRIVRMEFRKRMVRKERMVRIVRDVCNERYVRYERKIGNGNRRWRASSLLPSLPLFDSLSLPISFPPPRHSFPPPRHSCAPSRHSRAPLQKSNNFESFFGD